MSFGAVHATSACFYGLSRWHRPRPGGSKCKSGREFNFQVSAHLENAEDVILQFMKYMDPVFLANLDTVSVDLFSTSLTRLVQFYCSFFSLFHLWCDKSYEDSQFSLASSKIEPHSASTFSLIKAQFSRHLLALSEAFLQLESHFVSKSPPTLSITALHPIIQRFIHSYSELIQFENSLAVGDDCQHSNQNLLQNLTSLSCNWGMNVCECRLNGGV